LRRSKHSDHSAKPDDGLLSSKPTNKPTSSGTNSVSDTVPRPSRQSQKTLSIFDAVPNSPTSELAGRNRIISKIRDRRSDPLGLNVIYEPNDSPTIDIIFVHGLGGTSQQTWSKNKDPTLFWPKEWLPFERNISTARVLSFGYNAHFAAAGSNIFNISDFAKELLFGMKFGMDKQSKLLGVGQVSCLLLLCSVV
jgi:hypothetical protein